MTKIYKNNKGESIENMRLPKIEIKSLNVKLIIFGIFLFLIISIIIFIFTWTEWGYWLDTDFAYPKTVTKTIKLDTQEVESYLVLSEIYPGYFDAISFKDFLRSIKPVNDSYYFQYSLYKTNDYSFEADFVCWNYLNEMPLKKRFYRTEIQDEIIQNHISNCLISGSDKTKLQKWVDKYTDYSSLDIRRPDGVIYQYLDKDGNPLKYIVEEKFYLRKCLMRNFKRIDSQGNIMFEEIYNVSYNNTWDAGCFEM
jgi:hypothetical protein